MKIATAALAGLLGFATNTKSTAANNDGMAEHALRGSTPDRPPHRANRSLNLFDASTKGSRGRNRREPKEKRGSHSMLMGHTLEQFLSHLVSYGDVSDGQKSMIQRIAGDYADPADPRSMSIPLEAGEELRSYLRSQVDAGLVVEDVAQRVAATLGLGELYPRVRAASAAASAAPRIIAEAVYTGEGNMVRLGRSNTMGPSSSKPGSENWYNGIWGYAVGQREYALQCHGNGFAIIDVTNPASNKRVQYIEMAGGGKNRDVVTYKNYAYVGAQQGGDLWVIDLYKLSGNNGHWPNSNPCRFQKLEGFNNEVHTINAAKGLLFLNSNFGACHILDIEANPWSPQLLFEELSGDCHDSYVREIDGIDYLFVSQGFAAKEAIYDLTAALAAARDFDGPDKKRKRILSQHKVAETVKDGNMFDHSSWLSDDNRFLFVTDELNFNDGITVFDVSGISPDTGYNPPRLLHFQTSLAAEYKNTVPHNIEVRGEYLYATYYDAGLRVFDISNPYLPVEVGKVETDRDPDGDGVLNRAFIPGSDNRGAWNAYPYLPSGNILVNDMHSGLHIVRADAPYGRPAWPASPYIFVERRSGGDRLTWTAAQNARGYSVERYSNRRWEVVDEHLVDATYIGGLQSARYRIKAVNGEGRSYSRPVNYVDSNSGGFDHVGNGACRSSRRPDEELHAGDLGTCMWACRRNSKCRSIEFRSDGYAGDDCEIFYTSQTRFQRIQVYDCFTWNEN